MGCCVKTNALSGLTAAVIVAVTPRIHQTTNNNAIWSTISPDNSLRGTSTTNKRRPMRGSNLPFLILFYEHLRNSSSVIRYLCGALWLHNSFLILLSHRSLAFCDHRNIDMFNASRERNKSIVSSIPRNFI